MPGKMNRNLKTAAVLFAFFATVSINASFIAAGHHLTEIGDEHDHASNCPLRAFLDICAVSAAFAIASLEAAASGHFKETVLKTARIFREINTPFSRAPPALV